MFAEADALYTQLLPTLDGLHILAETKASILRDYASLLRQTGRGGQAKQFEARARELAVTSLSDPRRHTVDAGDLLRAH
jgi:hypothetical protein